MVHRLVGNVSQVQADLSAAACHAYEPRQAQLMAYAACLHEYGAQHQWMGAAGGCRRARAGICCCCRVAQAGCRPPPIHRFLTTPLPAAAFIDADEFIVPAGADRPADLPALLRRYERYGGLGLNWRMFGSGARWDGAGAGRWACGGSTVRLR